MSARRNPEDEGIPDLDEDTRKKRGNADLDEELPLPGDRPLEANDLTTVREQLQGESINTRVARELPDEQPEAEDTVGHLVEETEDGVDVTKELVADETDDDEALSAEEAAMHHEDER